MEGDLENAKIQKLATEYSRVKSYASVLKKAVLDEQAKNHSLQEIIKGQEQKIRKHDQEMESLTFRNEQLTKRIYVLQQELQANNHGGKKSKSKTSSADVTNQANFSIIDEELQKKINQNAQLASEMADKEVELRNYKEKIDWLEEKMEKIQRDFAAKANKHKEELEKCQTQCHSKKKVEEACNKCKNQSDEAADKTNWQLEAERWKSECVLLKSKPNTNEQLEDYYESQIRDLIETKQMCKSETASLWADNNALLIRLEHLTIEKGALDNIVEKCNEELHITNENYQQQLDAMTEHLAAQNEKITKQYDEIQMLRHKLGVKK